MDNKEYSAAAGRNAALDVLSLVGSNPPGTPGDYEGRIKDLEDENGELREAVEILLGGKDNELD